MAKLDVRGVFYEPAANFKFKFGILPDNKMLFEERRIEELLERVEMKIGQVIAGNLGMKKITL